MLGSSMLIVRRILWAAGLLGVDADRLATDMGLARAQRDDPDARLPYERLQALWHEAAGRSGEASFGLRMIELGRSQPHDSVLGYAVMTSATLGDAYRRTIRYSGVVHDGVTVDLDERGDHACLRFGAHVPAGPTVHGVEHGLGLLNEIGRRAQVEGYRLREVRCQHGPPGSLDLHERVFQAPVRFHQPENGLVLDAELLRRPIPGADPTLCAIMERYLVGLRGSEAAPDSIGGRVKQAIVAGLRDGTPTEAAVARGLRCSTRTLRRRLSEEGASFQELLDGTRHEVAARHLEEGRIEISAIAFLLGFSEVSAFHRAFKRWAGCTALEYRRAHLAEKPSR